MFPLPMERIKSYAAPVNAIRQSRIQNTLYPNFQVYGLQESGSNL